jgi:hypothetical protein
MSSTVTLSPETVATLASLIVAKFSKVITPLREAHKALLVETIGKLSIRSDWAIKRKTSNVVARNGKKRRVIQWGVFVSDVLVEEEEETANKDDEDDDDDDDHCSVNDEDGDDDDNDDIDVADDKDENSGTENVNDENLSDAQLLAKIFREIYKVAYGIMTTEESTWCDEFRDGCGEEFPRLKQVVLQTIAKKQLGYIEKSEEKELDE